MGPLEGCRTFSNLPPMDLILTGILTFASTNIDDLFILSMWFGNKRYMPLEIIVGQYLGILALTGLSLALSLVGLWMDPAYLGLLGLFPIYLGLKSLWRLFRKKEQEVKIDFAEPMQNNMGNVLAVAGVTIANGGDNTGVYVPLFAAMGWEGKGMTVGVFIIMTFLWCLAAKYLAGHPIISKAADKYGHILAPLILIVLGLYILAESGAFGILN